MYAGRIGVLTLGAALTLYAIGAHENQRVGLAV